MSLSFLFWFMLLLILLFGGWRGYGPNGDRWYFGGSVLVFIALVILGLKVFGFPISGP